MKTDIKKNNLHDEVARIKSTYINMGKQIELDSSVKELLKNNEHIKNFDMYKMIPKVSYDDWTVCLYEEDNKFYYIDEDSITQVEPKMVLHPDEKYKTYFTEDGKPIYGLEELAEQVNFEFYCCGEGDDMNSYIVFNAID